MLAISLLDHLWNLVSPITLEKFIGFAIMGGVFAYMFLLSRKHKKELWSGIKGKNGTLEPPEIIILIVMMLYPVIVLSDVFLGLHASEGIFWSIDAIIFFALTGRVAMNKFGNNEEAPKSDQTKDGL